MSSSDITRAKEVLSTRLLRAGLRGNVLSRRRTLAVELAVASAGSNVHAVGIGRKIVEGKVTDQTCVRIYVVQKLAPSLLSPRDKLPETLDGIPTDVIETPPAYFAASCTDDRQKKQRPVIAGISASHSGVLAGTISYFCRSTSPADDPSSIYVLSNNHVFGKVNQALEGDDLLQPCPIDDGLPDDRFADFHRRVLITLGGFTGNTVDAAIGQLSPETEFSLEVCGIGKITGTTQAIEGMKVRKHGRTSGYTEGVVFDLSVDQVVGVDQNNPNIVALFENQMRIDRIAPFPSFALPGDSGSLVVSKSARRAVGLFFAVPDSGEYGLANHISDVLTDLEIELL